MQMLNVGHGKLREVMEKVIESRGILEAQKRTLLELGISRTQIRT